MPNGTKKSRCSNWSHEETVVLAELKKETFLKKREGRLIWEEIAQTISCKFPDQKRSQDQCRRRWETLTKVYKHIEKYCLVTGQDHSELDEDELYSMKLDTAYRQDWYDIVKQVCSQRKRKENDDDTDLIAVKRSKISDTCCSPSTVLSDPTWSGRDLCLCATTPRSISSEASSLQVEKPSPEEEMQRLRRENVALILEVAQLRQHRGITRQDQVLQNSSAEVRAHVKEPLQDAVRNCREVTVEHSSQVVQDSLGCELINIRSTPESFSDGQRSVAMNLAAFNGFDPFDSSSCFSTAPSFPITEFWDSPCTWIDGMRTYIERNLASAGGRKSLGYSTSTYQRRTQKGKEKRSLNYWPDPLTRTHRGVCRLHRKHKWIQVAWTTVS